MFKKYAALAALLTAGALVSIPVLGQDGQSVVAAAVKAMGADNLKTIQITGSGSAVALIGQNVNPTTGWNTVRVRTYTRQLDLAAGASSLQSVRVQNNADAPFNQVITANSPWAQQHDFWVTPWGFLKGAQSNPVTVRTETLDGVKYSVVTFTLQNKYKVEGYIDDKSMVARVRTWVDNDVLGDMLVEGSYNNYKAYGGVQVPGMMIVKQGGYATAIVVVSDAKVNAPVTIPAAAPAPPAAPPVTVTSEKIADGVYYITGGTHHSVLVEFGNHVTLIEAPQNEARTLAVLAEVKKLYPNKPLTEVVNTHHHFDHSGGLRTIVDAGATIITNDINKDFYEKAFANPRTLNPDRLSQSKKKPVIMVTGDKKVLSDATRTLELDLIKNNAHNDGILMAFLPKEKILVEADLYTPPAPGAAPAANAPVPPNALALVANLETLRLDFETILPLHGPGKATRADLYAFVRKPLVPVSALPAPAGAGGGRGGRVSPGAATPDAAVTAVVNMACTSCHGIDRVNGKKDDKDGWTNTVTRMRDKGAELTDAQVNDVIDFLARTHGK